MAPRRWQTFRFFSPRPFLLFFSHHTQTHTHTHTHTYTHTHTHTHTHTQRQWSLSPLQKLTDTLLFTFGISENLLLLFKPPTKATPRFEKLLVFVCVCGYLWLVVLVISFGVSQIYILSLPSSPTQQGIWSVSWCPHDPNWLLSCGKDSKIFCWNISTGQIAQEIRSPCSYTYDVSWAPHLPSVLSASSLDRRVSLFSLHDIGESEGDDFEFSSPAAAAAASRPVSMFDFFTHVFIFVLFCFVLFCFVLFCFILFCFVLFFILFHFILFYFNSSSLILILSPNKPPQPQEHQPSKMAHSQSWGLFWIWWPTCLLLFFFSYSFPFPCHWRRRIGEKMRRAPRGNFRE